MLVWTCLVSPLVWTTTPNSLIGAPLGSDANLECNFESYPISETHWSKASGNIIQNSTKYTTKIMNSPKNPHKSEMM